MNPTAINTVIGIIAGVFTIVTGVLLVRKEFGPKPPQAARGNTTSTPNPLVSPTGVFRRHGLNFDDVINKFRDRQHHLNELHRLLGKQDGCRLIVIAGQSGIGKTALLAKIGIELEKKGNDSSGRTLGGLLFLSCGVDNPLNAAGLCEQLLLLLDEDQRKAVTDCWPSGEGSTLGRFRSLLDKFQSGKYVILLDGLESAITPEGSFASQDLKGLFEMFFNTPHTLQMVSTTHPDKLVIGYTSVLNYPLDEGLPESDAIAFLQEMDIENRCGLRSASPEHLREIVRRCSGIPNTLKAVFTELQRNTRLTIPQLVKDTALFDKLVQNPTAERYRDLPTDELRVLEALAVFGEPTPCEALSTMSAPADLDPILDRLDRRQFISFDRGHETYNLTGTDRTYLLNRLENSPDPAPLDLLRQRRIHYHLETAQTFIRAAFNSRSPLKERYQAKIHADKALSLSSKISNNQLIGRSHLLCAEVNNWLQHFQEALQHAKGACEYAELASDTFTQAQGLVMRAGIEAKGNTEYADFDLMSRARELASGIGQEEYLAELWRSTAQIALRVENWEMLETALTEAETVSQGELDSGVRGDIYQIRGEALAMRARWNEAQQMLERARADFEQQNNGVGVCAATGWLGIVNYRLGNKEGGLHSLRVALFTERYDLDSREGVAKWLHALGELFLDDNDPRRALSALWLSRRLREQIGSKQVQATENLIEAARRHMSPKDCQAWERAFSPQRAEFGEYAFTWGIGPFQKHPHNPILRPHGNGWQSLAIYNPTACVPQVSGSEEKQVMLLYRGEGPGENGRAKRVSSIGLAVSHDGVNFDRQSSPVICPSLPHECLAPKLEDAKFGCEDPRIVYVKDKGRYYMTYTAYDGLVARLSMATSQDLKTWDKSPKPLLSDRQWDSFFSADIRKKYPLQPRGWTKSGAIIPVPISGYYWMYFGDTHIWVAKSKDLRRWKVLPKPVMSPRPNAFDSALVEPGPTPEITDAGILLIYNGASTADGKNYDYAVGQALFSREDPAHLLSRSDFPVLSPEGADEREGQVNNVVFAEGLVSFQGQWCLYYGMADSRVGLATATMALQ